MHLRKKEIWEATNEVKVMYNEGFNRAGNGCKNMK